LGCPALTLNSAAWSASVVTSLKRLRDAADVSSTMAAFCWVDWSMVLMATLISAMAVACAWLSLAI
jgi:hypothetical protein